MSEVRRERQHSGKERLFVACCWNGVVYVKVKGLKPAKSRLLKPEVAVQSGGRPEGAGEWGT